jgi:hypothetical protein
MRQENDNGKYAIFPCLQILQLSNILWSTVHNDPSFYYSIIQHAKRLLSLQVRCMTILPPPSPIRSPYIMKITTEPLLLSNQLQGVTILCLVTTKLYGNFLIKMYVFYLALICCDTDWDDTHCYFDSFLIFSFIQSGIAKQYEGHDRRISCTCSKPMTIPLGSTQSKTSQVFCMRKDC